MNEKDYLCFYQISEENLSSYRREKIKDIVDAIVIHLFEPKISNGKTALVLHGYFDHTGGLKNVINMLLMKGVRVVTYDLQGHGLSTGVRGVIHDFYDYTDTFRKVLDYCSSIEIMPNFLIAHSTGAAICIDFLLRFKFKFENVIFIAPLVRVASWPYVVAASTFVPLFTQDLVRKFSVNSGDQNYLSFVQQDPLQCRAISVPWVVAMIAWNKKVEEYTPSTQKVYVIQGNLDETVDWQYNLQFLRKKFTVFQAAIIEGGRHQLFNDSKIIVKQVLTIIDNQISSSKKDNNC